MPAPLASSMAYWISGLSTTGSISLGLALVTGRKRVPSPATGNTALVPLAIAIEILVACRRGRTRFAFALVGRVGRAEGAQSASMSSLVSPVGDHCLQLLFIQHRNAELAGLVELAAGLGAGDHIRGLLRYAAGDFTAMPLDHRLGIVARKCRQRAGKHECQARQLAGACSPRRRLGPMYSGSPQIGNHLPVMRLGKKLQDALNQHRADVAHLEQRLFVGGQYRVERPEVLREVCRGGLAHVTDAERVDEPC